MRWRFQSTLPRRERRAEHEEFSLRLAFQSTLPRRERLLHSAFEDIKRSFQSTLPRRERRQPAHNPQVGNVISIHAPAKGATLTHSTM